MSIVFKKYARHKGLDLKTLYFLLDGQRIADDETPITIQLEDKDRIDCILSREW